MVYVALIVLASGVGFLIWKGSDSIARALVGAIIVPVVALVVLAIIAPRPLLESGGPVALIALLVAIIGWLAWSHRRS